MNKPHAVVEKGFCGFLAAGLAASIVFGWLRVSNLNPPEDTGLLSKLEGERGSEKVSPEIEGDVLDELKDTKTLSAYMSIIERNPFVRFEPRVAAGDSQSTGKDGKEKVEEKPISWVYRGMARVGSSVRAVLEDKDSKETFFVSVGGQLGNLKVLDITQDTVLLSRADGSDVEIPLAESRPGREKETKTGESGGGKKTGQAGPSQEPPGEQAAP